MKRYSKILFSFLAVIVFALIMKMPVKAYVTNSLNPRQTYCTTNTITVSWTKPVMSSDSSLLGYILCTSDENYYTTITNTNATSATITVPANYVGYMRLYTYYATSYGSSNYSYSSCWCNTIPSNPTSRDYFGIYSLSANKVSFRASRYNTNHRTQVAVYKGNSATPYRVINTSYYSTDYIPISKNIAYRYQIRYYYTNSSTGKTYYSNWSPFRGFMSSNIKYKYKRNKKGVTFTFKKASGCSKYVIYVSKTSSDSGFYYVKTQKAKSKKSYTCKVTSKYGKKKLNYFRVIPYINLQGYSGPSDIFATTEGIYLKK